MKYKNDTGQEVLIRLDDGKGSYIWKVIIPGGAVELSDQYASNLGFVPDTGEEPEVQEKPIMISKIETKMDIQKVEKEIDDIKGIGKKRSEKINKVIEKHAGARR